MDPVEMLAIIEREKLECLSRIAKAGCSDEDFDLRCEERSYEVMTKITDEMERSFGETFAELRDKVETLAIQSYKPEFAALTCQPERDIIEELEEVLERKLQPGKATQQRISTFSQKC